MISTSVAHLVIARVSQAFANGATCYYFTDPTDPDESLESLHRKLRTQAKADGKRWKFFKHGDAIGIKPKGIK